jgi:hypothetical protein
LIVSARLIETDALSFGNTPARSGDFGGNVAALHVFTVSILVGAGADGANARKDLSVAIPAAAVGAIEVLGLLVTGAVVFLKRPKRNHAIRKN